MDSFAKLCVLVCDLCGFACLPDFTAVPILQSPSLSRNVSPTEERKELRKLHEPGPVSLDHHINQTPGHYDDLDHLMSGNQLLNLLIIESRRS